MSVPRKNEPPLEATVAPRVFASGTLQQDPDIPPDDPDTITLLLQPHRYVLRPQGAFAAETWQLLEEARRSGNHVAIAGRLARTIRWFPSRAASL